jgi:ABC-type sugar transport system ATPase subunit
LISGAPGRFRGTLRRAGEFVSASIPKQVLLELTDIAKSFGATKALRGVHLSLKSGEVHALVGENGAGKSTLFKVCSGVVQADRGEMQLDSQIYRPRTLFEAQRSRVALVFQEMTIIPTIGVAENIFADRLRRFAGPLGFTRWQSLHRAAAKILEEIGADFSVRSDLSRLSLGQLKVIEIARALSYEPKVLLLDETTAFLNTQEVDLLFRVVMRLKERNIAVAFISHHLDEVDRLANRFTILKDGKYVGSYPVGELNRTQIESKMVGRELGASIFPRRRSRVAGEALLSFSAASAGMQLRPTSFSVKSGEIVGMGGLKGSGGEQALEAAIGELQLDSGHLSWQGRNFHPRGPYDAWRRGIAYVPGDRTGEALLMDFSVQMNLTLAQLVLGGPLVDFSQQTSLVTTLLRKLQIKAETPKVVCSSLSGGNLQKVVIGKCMAVRPKLLLLNNPTRGIDIGARAQIYQVIRDLVEAGAGVLFVTEDLSELLGLSDRIFVFRKGRISREFAEPATCTEEEVVSHMT